MAHFYFENTPHGVRKDGTKLNTRTHAEYICREGEYAKMKDREEDLVFKTAGNMPEWADTPMDFWEAAELHRRKNGRAYREFRFALQEEFTLTENIELVEKLLIETGIHEQHAYTYAIHDKTAAFDAEHHNIHCHLMFSEKTIEKNRPLPAEKYFKQYAENTQGKPTQGYRTNAYFAQTETTVHLRKRWAELVNKKFAEKGLACRISEKTLYQQKLELIAAGKTEEAELLNRTPAPHLGKAYRNPVIMGKIHEQIQQTDQAADEDVPAQNPDFSTLDSQEQTIRLFANDVVIRQVARQIQQERQKLLQELANRQAEEEAERIVQEPYAITLEDIYGYAQKQANNFRQQAAQKLQEYLLLKRSIATEKQLHSQTEEQFLGQEYITAKGRYAALSQELSALEESAASLFGKTDQIDELALYAMQIEKIRKQRSQRSKQLYSFRRKIQGPEKEKFAQILSELTKENEQKILQAKAVYREYLQNKKQAVRYTELQDKLADEDHSLLIYSRQIPRLLNRSCRINGTQPVRSLQIIGYMGDSYALLNQPGQHATAIKIGDPITRGTVPRYQLTFQGLPDKKRTRWIVQNVQEDKDAQTKKAAVVHLYNRSQNPAQNVSPRQAPTRLHPAIEQAAQNREKIVADKIASIAGDMLEYKDRSGRFNLRWNEDSLRDKAVQDEQKIYQGWAL